MAEQFDASDEQVASRNGGHGEVDESGMDSCSTLVTHEAHASGANDDDVEL